ncbi:MAG: hypothetical protein JSV45_02910 [Chromatiales bacterium]|nr:MAG: hypothetical protein JSV45_02910 [Chromatiales bacterium]
MSRNLPGVQKGAALIVGLVMLLVLTLLAVSTMRTAAMELLMASNAQYRENAFRLAESGIADAMSQANVAALGTTPGWSMNIAPQTVDALDGGYEASVNYLGASEAYGSYSPADYEFLHYRIDATGRAAQRGARSVQSQGLVRATLKGLE